MSRAVFLSSGAQRTLESLPAEIRRRIRKALLTFAATGRGDLKRLRGTRGREDLSRLRVGDYRIVFATTPTEVRVTRMIYRGEGYDWL